MKAQADVFHYSAGIHVEWKQYAAGKHKQVKEKQI